MAANLSQGQAMAIVRRELCAGSGGLAMATGAKKFFVPEDSAL
jgi:hypothetical protein